VAEPRLQAPDGAPPRGGTCLKASRRRTGFACRLRESRAIDTRGPFDLLWREGKFSINLKD
jgi:hypothetical protein